MMVRIDAAASPSRRLRSRSGVKRGEIFWLERSDGNAVETTIIQRDAPAHAEKPGRPAERLFSGDPM